MFRWRCCMCVTSATGCSDVCAHRYQRDCTHRSPNPQLPRRLKRFRMDSGGSLAIIRDTSMSMEGAWSNWASSLALQIVDLARQQKIRLGYMEFNHKLMTCTVDDQFFVRDYDRLATAMRVTKCSGVTDYQLPLSTALMEFGKRNMSGGGHDRNILFITDGLPTAGDKELRTELEEAVRLDVCIHTLFIGTTTFPPILQKLSEVTGGTQFRATRQRGSASIVVSERTAENDAEHSTSLWQP
eukprot:m.41437 g.41437  ORF g.41437 m.41437 type:complete len:241 (-) comp14926_c0_seq3:116-838(-)